MAVASSTQANHSTGEEAGHCYFCFQPAERVIGKYRLCIPCHYKFEEAVDRLVLAILERGSFREALMKRGQL